MRQLQPVLWTKGVLLTPQHLQAQDRHHEDTLAFQIGALLFCPWGFAELTFDHAALEAGTLVINSASGRFPDGLLFDAPAAGPTPAPKLIADAFGADQRSVMAYLAIPEYRPGARNITRPGEPAAARWQIDEQLVRDETTGLAERPIQVAPPSLKILLEGENSDGYTTLPVARPQRTALGAYAFDHTFVPPVVNFAVSDALQQMARRLVERLAARAAALSGSRRQRNLGLTDFSVADVGAFWLLYTVNTHFPGLRHLAETRQGHPSALWEAMLQLVGALGSFSTSLEARVMPTYDHLRLGECFADLERLLYQLLDGAIVDTVVSLPLKVVRPTLHAVAIEQPTWLDAPQWFLAVSGAGRQHDLIARVLQGCKVGAADVVETLVRQALPGMELTHVASPPGAVPVQLDFQYFAVAKTGAAWEAIVLARNLAVYVPEGLADARFELVMLLK